MGKLRILASGQSPQAQAQKRGKQFESLMIQVLRHFGYEVVDTSINYAGMEIDIEGQHKVSGIPLYAECKYYDIPVDAPKLQAFYGKYMTRWHRDRRCHGLFIALPGLNPHAQGFYRENLYQKPDFILRLYEEDQVLGVILDSGIITRPEVISAQISEAVGVPGDWAILYTDSGLFWLQYVVLPGNAFPTAFAVFSSSGTRQQSTS